MTATYTIAEAAARSGFTASALRFYEGAGLVAPARSEAGYRVFDDRAVARLRFVARAKQLGLSLEEITELVGLWDDDRCEPVAHRLRVLVGEKLAATRERIAELSAFAAELEHVAAGLTADPGDGPCTDGCPCQAAAPATPSPPIACTLTAEQLPGRVDDWRRLLAERAGEPVRDASSGAVTITFPADPAVAARVAGLAAAEQSCCSFFTFTVRIAPTATELTVTAPEEATPLVEALFGFG